MKKMLIGIGMLSILSISAMATNVTNYKKTQKQVMNVYSYLEFLDKEKYEDSYLIRSVRDFGNDIIKLHDYDFNEETNTLELVRIVKELPINKEYRTGFNSAKYQNIENYSNFKIFSKENRVKLTETLNLEKCSLLNSFGNTKVIERFIGTQGADFSITYNIEKNHCDNLSKKIDKLYYPLKEQVKKGQEVIGHFVLDKQK